MNKIDKIIYTIGYAPHSIESFLNLLKKHSITAIADVRSSPYSQFKPEFNSDLLQNTLKNEGIAYVFLGKELGARVEDSECYINGQVDFNLVSKSHLFREGIKRLKNGMSNYRVSLLCAEKDPITCHRTLLICRELARQGIRVKHILFNGSIEDQIESEIRLLKLHKLDHPNMFKSEQERIDEAYNLQAQKIAYEEKNNNIGDE